MKKINKFNLLLLIAALLFAAGILWSFQTFNKVSTVNEKIEKELADMAVMQGDVVDLSNFFAAKEACQGISKRSPVNFESLIGDTVIVASENIRASEVALEDNWFLLRREIVIDDGAIGKVITLIKKAEAERPPWKLASCKIKSSAITPGQGRVVLLFKTVEKR